MESLGSECMVILVCRWEVEGWRDVGGKGQGRVVLGIGGSIWGKKGGVVMVVRLDLGEKGKWWKEVGVLGVYSGGN